jgi:hypothetical protein
MILYYKSLEELVSDKNNIVDDETANNAKYINDKIKSYNIKCFCISFRTEFEKIILDIAKGDNYLCFSINSRYINIETKDSILQNLESGDEDIDNYLKTFSELEG